MISPYFGKDKNTWKKITQSLIKQHPLKENEIADLIISAWDDIFESSIGKHNLKIGEHIFPKPQVIGALLHELIPASIAIEYPSLWRGEKSAGDKDLVYIPDNKYSIEIKTSSNSKSIFGNRSYAQETTNGKKGKDGFYLAVNFEKFSKKNKRPNIQLIRFGWLDHTDWIGQKAATGQQARLSSEIYELKFKTLYIKK